MRGKVILSFDPLPRKGITPAYAGKSFTPLRARCLGEDHPRVCGEKACMQCTLQGHGGSPPRMRGKGPCLAAGLTAAGITPAYAGKRLKYSWKSGNAWDHPRVCGEKLKAVFVSPDKLGSPPRMRGKGHPGSERAGLGGITPAYAGKRLKRSHSIGHFSCILCLFHSVLHRASASGGSRAGPCAPPCLPAQNAVPV